MRIREELRPEQERAAELLQSLVTQMEVRGTGMCDVVTCHVWVRQMFALSLRSMEFASFLDLTVFNSSCLNFHFGFFQIMRLLSDCVGFRTTKPHPVEKSFPFLSVFHHGRMVCICASN